MSTSLSPTRWCQVGPHAYYDLVRLARRGRTAQVRVLYILALFAGPSHRNRAAIRAGFDFRDRTVLAHSPAGNGAAAAETHRLVQC